MFIDHKKPLINFDKIEFDNQDDVENLLAWRDKNKDLVRKFNFVLERGYLEFKHNWVKIIFEKNGDYVYLDMLIKDKEKDGLVHFQTFKWFYKNGTIEIIHPSEKEYKEEVYNTNTQTMITVFASLMAYMEHYKEDKEVIKKNTQISVKSKKNKNGKKKANVRKIKRYAYNVNFQSPSKEKREYHLDEDKSWTVRGHWRNLKNGNQIWINPYPKGNVEGKNNPATYKF
jgi:hypothetical protein